MGRWLLLLLACNNLADAERPTKPAACELLKTRHLAIQVKLNGHGPYRMIFDTGSPVILTSSAAARDCELIKSSNPATTNIFPGQAVLSSIEAGGVKSENIAALIIDHPTLKAIEGTVGKIDGIVGHSFFSRFKTTIDYSTSSIALAPSTYQPADAMNTIMNAMMNRPRNVIMAPAAQWGVEIEKPADNAPGVLITRVANGSPAATGGLRTGDRILTIDGRWTDSVDDCFRVVERVMAGQPVVVEISRENKVSRASVTPQPGS